TVSASTAAKVVAPIVVEGANLPIGPAGQTVLAERGTTVVPDFVANAGGIVAAAYAMDARRSPFPAERGDIVRTVDAKIRSNTELVLARAAAAGITTHSAARELAGARIRAAMDLRGRTAV